MNILKQIVCNIQDNINEFLINKVKTPHIIHNAHVFRIEHIVTRLQDVQIDDDIVDAGIKQYTMCTDVLTNKDYVIPLAVLTEEECNNVQVPYIVRTTTLPLTFKM